MRVAISGVHIHNNLVFLVLKGATWILVGGKPDSHEESDIACLLRKTSEEIPHAKVVIRKHYKDITGQTPNKGDQLTAKCYFIEISGNTTPAAEIGDARYFSREELSYIKISDITKKAIDSLIADGYLK